MFRQLLSIGVVGALCVGLLGCGGSSGPELSKVTGKVMYNGQGVEGAVVTFMPTEGPLATGMTDSSGEFTLTTGGKPGAVLGDHKVGITKSVESGPAKTGMTPEDMMKMQKEQMEKQGAEGAAEGPKSAIPAKYAVPATSGLTATVSSSASENEFEFTLED